MEEIKVGEYVRTTEGYIAKLKEIEATPYKNAYIFDSTIRDIRNLVYEEDNFLWKSEIKKYIEKHSFNIIDLIEVGDYVNGEKILSISLKRDYLYAERIAFKEKDIKSIVTKEQFESIKYEVIK